MQMEKASSAEDLLQMCLKALEGRGGEADVRERLGLPAQEDGNNGKKKDAGAVQKALLQVANHLCPAGAGMLFQSRMLMLAWPLLLSLNLALFG